MSTTEHEIVEPVDLCTPDGRRLNPAAPRAGRAGRCTGRTCAAGWGRTKRWDYWAILAGDLFVSLTFADVDYLGIVAAEWGELGLGSHRRPGGDAVPLARGVRLPDLPGTEPLRFANRNLELAIVDDSPTARTSRRTGPSRRGGGAGELDVDRRGPRRARVAQRGDPVVRHAASSSRPSTRPDPLRHARRWAAAATARSRCGPATRGACSTSAAAAGPTRPAGTGAAARAAPTTGRWSGIQIGGEVDRRHRVHRERRPRRRAAGEARRRARRGTTAGTTRMAPVARAVTRRPARPHAASRASTSTPRPTRRCCGTEVHQVFGTWSGAGAGSRRTGCCRARRCRGLRRGVAVALVAGCATRGGKK